MPLPASEAIAEQYLSGEYLEKNPTFHVERAEFKAGNVLKMLQRHQLQPTRLGDVGCGAGEVLRLLHERLETASQSHGYELSPDGYQLCQERQTDQLRYFNSNLFDSNQNYDLMICMDVFEHVDDPLDFLRSLKRHGQDFVFHIPLDLSAQSVLRGSPLLHVRKKLGHLHYFTKGTALATLRDAGYEVVDSFYTPASLHKPGRLAAYVAMLPRALAFAVHQDLAARMFGGFSLMVLAR